MTPRRILFIGTPIAPITPNVKSGGGVNTTLRYLLPEMASRGHQVAVIAPEGSVIEQHNRVAPPIHIHQMTGTTPPSSVTAAASSLTHVDGNGMIERTWEHACAVQKDYDIIIAQSFDWLPYYLTPFFTTPLLHWVTLSAGIDVIDRMIVERYQQQPEHFSFYSRTQAATLSRHAEHNARIIPGGVDADLFRFCPEVSEPSLVWSARISPEKGLEDAVQIANITGHKLHVCGTIENQLYWERILRADTNQRIIYHGALPHDQLRHVLGQATAMLATPKWVEAFGISLIESLACGTPVISYAEGGPKEIIENNVSGFLVPRNDINAMVSAVNTISSLSRQAARQRAEHYSYGQMALRIEDWISTILI
jgi:UDP-glucose:tetrahydrobiopterin glucosyltransferase